MLAIWGDAGGIPSETDGPLATWREWATDVRGLRSTAGIIWPRKTRRRPPRRCWSSSGRSVRTREPLVMRGSHDGVGSYNARCLVLKRCPHATGDGACVRRRTCSSMIAPIDRQATFSGTKDVAGAAALSITSGSTPISRPRLPGFAGPLAVRQFKGGQSNPTYLLETPDRRYVLRRKPPGKLLPSAHAVDREFRVISALHAQGFPVAAPLVYCADDSVAGTPFYVMAYVDGRVFWEPHMPDCDAGRARGGLRRDERDTRAAARLRSGGDRARRLRPRRELRRAPGRALVEAVSRVARPKRSTRWSS